jgi:hypothetical protein
VAYAFVQGPAVVQAKSVTSVSKTFAAASAANNLVVAGGAANFGTAGTQTFTFSDTVNAWSTDVSDSTTSQTGHVAVGHAVATTGATLTVTMTMSASASLLALSVNEYSGGATASPYDTGNKGGGTSTAPSSGAATPASAGSLAVGCLSCGATTITAGTGWTERQNVGTSTNGRPSEFEDALNVSGSQTATWSLSTSVGWQAALAIYKPAAAAATPQGWRAEFPERVSERALVTAY